MAGELIARTLLFSALTALAFMPLERVLPRRASTRKRFATDLGFATVGQLLTTLGTLLLAAVAFTALRGAVNAQRDGERVELLSWYWHFVDAVWVVVFTTVYVVGL